MPELNLSGDKNVQSFCTNYFHANMASRRRIEDSEIWRAIEARYTITDVALFIGVHPSVTS